jgi:hypothetical protein
MGVTVLVFELSAPESEFSTYLRSLKGQITQTYVNKFLCFLMDNVLLFNVKLKQKLLHAIPYIVFVFFHENKGTLNL